MGQYPTTPSYGQVPQFYQPPVQPTVPYQVQQTAQIISGMNWVQGPSSVKSAQQPANSVCVYFDSDPGNENIHYIKTTDALGRCTSLSAFRSEEIPIEEVGVPKSNMQPVDTSGFVTKDEFESMLDEYFQKRRQNKGNYKKEHTNNAINGDSK